MAQGALLLPRKRKPDQYTRVNLAHPMTRKLMAFYCHAGSISTGPVLWDCVRQAPGAGATNIGYTTTSEGKALSCSAPTSAAGYTNIRNAYAQNTSQCTLIARIRLRTKPGAGTRCYPLLLCGSSAGSRGTGLGFDSSGFCVAGEAGSNGIDATRKAGSVDRLNEWVTIGASSAYTSAWAHPVASSGRLWENGVRIGDGAVTGAHTATQTIDRINVGRDGSSYFATFTGDILWVAAFNDWLTDTEHAWWHANAYEVLQQQNNPSFYGFPSGAAAAFIARQGLTVQQAVNRASTF